MENKLMYTPRNLSDCIGEIIRKNVLDITDEELPVLACMKCKQVIQAVCSFDPTLENKLLDSVDFGNSTSVEEKTERAFETVFGKFRDKVFLSLQTKRPGPAMSVVMFIVGCALVDAKSTYYLEKCMNMDWLVPITSPNQVDGVALEALNKGTFVNNSMSTTFYPELYAVSCFKV